MSWKWAVEEKDQTDRYSAFPANQRLYKYSLNWSLSSSVNLGLLLLGSCANGNLQRSCPRGHPDRIQWVGFLCLSSTLWSASFSMSKRANRWNRLQNKSLCRSSKWKKWIKRKGIISNIFQNISKNSTQQVVSIINTYYVQYYLMKLHQPTSSEIWKC